jgi:poly(ADP-ribose) glycohydrolase ARH3
MNPPSLADRFAGCLLGLAAGDALGAHFEAQPPEFIARRYPSVEALLANPPEGRYCYTDDTQMAIGVAQTLAVCGCIDESVICRNFAANYMPSRGYGRGARVVLDAMSEGGDHKYWAENLFPGGSHGNGAAMRVAPVGLMFRDDATVLWEQARLSAIPTHVHPLGIEGAQVMALAVGEASRATSLDRPEFFAGLADHCRSPEYAGPLRRAAQVEHSRDLALFGNGIAAADSVVTAVACFGLSPDSYERTIVTAILLGGDTDTIAAMAGAISGAYLGRQAIPQWLLDRLEDGHQGRSFLEELADQLLAAYEDKSRAVGLP